MRKLSFKMALPYYLWIGLFVIAPLFLIIYQSFLDYEHKFTFNNYLNYFSRGTYLQMTVNSFFYAFVVTMLAFLISYPTALLLTKLKHKQLWLMLIILPMWINLLLKAYAFIGILGIHGAINNFLGLIGIAPKQILFTDFGFVFVASYVELPFMIFPIFNSLSEISPSLIEASSDLGASPWQSFRNVIFPLSLSGVRSGAQAVFIPALSLFMLTRLIGGNRIITLGTAIEQYFLVTQNWGMGSTIGVVLIFVMVIVMWLTGKRGVVNK